MALELTPPRDLPAASSVSSSESLIVDNGSAVRKATPKQVVDAGRPVASQAEAIAGTSNTTAMTPLTTAQALAIRDQKYIERSDLVSAIAGGDLDDVPEGSIISAAGLDYLKMPAGHALYGTDPISDMPGYVESNPAPLYARKEYYARDPAFGIAGDGDGAGGGTDDTAAIKAAIQGLDQNDTLIFNKGYGDGESYYNITSLLLDDTTIYTTIAFDEGVRLYGIAETSQRAMVELRGAQKMKIRNLQMRSDGTANSPSFATQYACGLRLYPRLTTDGYGADASVQHMRFMEGQISGLSRALVIGNLEGESATPNMPMSENFFYGFDFFWVEAAILMNAGYGFASFTDCKIIAQQGNNGAWWDDANGFLIKSLEGGVTFNGGELQRAIVDGEGLVADGGEVIVCGGTVLEFPAPSYIGGDGRLEVLDHNSGFISSQSHARFVARAGSTGYLNLRGEFNKNGGTSGGFDGLLVDASLAPDFNYDLDVRLSDMQWDANSPLILGGRPNVRRIDIRDDDLDGAVTYAYRPQGDSWDWEIASNDGAEMSTTLDATDKAGWSQTIGSSSDLDFAKYTSDLPDGAASAIRFQQSTAQVYLGTPAGASGIKLKGHEKVLSFSMKDISGTSAFIGVLVQFFDGAGTSLGAATNILALDDTAIAALNVDDDWQHFSVPMNTPAAARYGRVLLRGASDGSACDIGITGFTFT